jgi:hypothetical protein
VQSAVQGAWDDALAWLDLAAACARTPADAQAATEATAALLDRAGWGARATRVPIDRAASPSIGGGDVDLAGSVELPAAELAHRREGRAASAADATSPR